MNHGRVLQGRVELLRLWSAGLATLGLDFLQCGSIQIAIWNPIFMQNACTSRYAQHYQKLFWLVFICNLRSRVRESFQGENHPSWLIWKIGLKFFWHGHILHNFRAVLMWYEHISYGYNHLKMLALSLRIVPSICIRHVWKLAFTTCFAQTKTSKIGSPLCNFPLVHCF